MRAMSYPPGYRVTRLDPVPPRDEDRLRFDTTAAEDRRHARDDDHEGKDRWRERAQAKKRAQRVNVRTSPPRWNPDADGVLGHMRERNGQLARIRALREAVRAHEAPLFAGDIETLTHVPIVRRRRSRLDSAAPKDRLSRLEAGTLLALLLDGLAPDDTLGPEVADAAAECEGAALTIRNVHTKGHSGDRAAINPGELRSRRTAVGLGLRALARQAAAFLLDRTADSVYAQLQRVEGSKASTLHLDTVWAVSAALVEAEVAATGSLAVVGGSENGSGFPTGSVGIGSLSVPCEKTHRFSSTSSRSPSFSPPGREPMIEADTANERRSREAHEELVRTAHEGGRWYRAAPAG